MKVDFYVSGISYTPISSSFDKWKRKEKIFTEALYFLWEKRKIMKLKRIYALMSEFFLDANFLDYWMNDSKKQQKQNFQQKFSTKNCFSNVYRSPMRKSNIASMLHILFQNHNQWTFLEFDGSRLNIYKYIWHRKVDRTCLKKSTDSVIRVAQE